MDRVNEITDDVFSVLGQIRRAEEKAYPDPDTLHREMRACIEGAMRRALQLGFPQTDAQDIGYVLVALVDEIVVSKGGALRDFWLQRLLQMYYFKENVAGNGVFDRLGQLLRDPTRIDVLRIYYLALLMGFRGRYQFRGGEIELADVMDEVAAALRRGGFFDELPLAPHAGRPSDARNAVKRNLPLVTLGVATVIVALMVIMGLRCSLSSRAEDSVEQIEQATEALRQTQQGAPQR